MKTIKMLSNFFKSLWIEIFHPFYHACLPKTKETPNLPVVPTVPTTVPTETEGEVLIPEFEIVSNIVTYRVQIPNGWDTLLVNPNQRQPLVYPGHGLETVEFSEIAKYPRMSVINNAKQDKNSNCEPKILIMKNTKPWWELS